MSNVEKEYNKRFKNQDLTNDDFDTEGLWDSISEKIASTENTTDRAGFIRYRKLGLGLGLMGVLALIYFMLNNPTPNTDGLGDRSSSHESTKAVKSKVPNSIQLENIIEESGQAVIRNQFNQKITRQNAEEVSNSQKINKQAKKLQTISNSTTSRIQKEKIKTESTEVLEKEEALNSEDNIYLDIKSISTITSFKNESNKSETSAINNIASSTDTNKLKASKWESDTFNPNDLSDLDLIPPSALKIFKTADYLMPKANLPNVVMTSNKSIANARWKIGGTVGSNLVYFNYASQNIKPLADKKNLSEFLTLGTTYGLSANLFYNNDIIIGTGIDYNQLWSMFENGSITNTQILKEDQLVKVWLNAFTGDTLNVNITDTLVNQSTFRSVVHFNSYQRISIPFKIGIMKTKGNWIYGIQTGLALNFTIKQEGKGLDHNQVPISFETKDLIAPYKPLDLGLMIQPILGYKINDSWTINLTPQWRWSRKADLGIEDLSVGIHQLNLNIGIHYCLDR